MKNSPKKERLDLLVLSLHPQLSRTHVQSLIMQGKVSVDGMPVTKAGTAISKDAVVTVDLYEPPYVSRAGIKLAAVLDHFHLAPEGMVCMDAGLSTGGFTDCLLQRGAKKVYGIDVGYGQVHEKIRADKRVVVMEKTNLRHVTALPEPIDMVTLDLSFISVLKVIDAVRQVLKKNGTLIVLIKPQFEATKKDVGAGGIVSDTTVHERVIQEVVSGLTAKGFSCNGVIPSPIEGTMGNKEFLAYFTYQQSAHPE
ncbi:MAG: TlyA family RNA methyltransferase [Candidatus Babeliales bacterium]